jgi:hypothetical protein
MSQTTWPGTRSSRSATRSTSVAGLKTPSWQCAVISRRSASSHGGRAETVRKVGVLWDRPVVVAGSSQCGFNTSPRRPRVGPTLRRLIATLVLASLRPSNGSDGVSGMVRSNGLWISLPQPSLQWPLQPTISRRLPPPHARWRALLGDLETYVSGQSDVIIDYATARRCEEPISTAITESTVQWLNAQQQMRWSPRGAHLMLKVRTAVVNGYTRPGLCRRGALGSPPVSESGLTPHVLGSLPAVPGREERV